MAQSVGIPAANNGDSTVFASESNLNQNNQQENKEMY